MKLVSLQTTKTYSTWPPVRQRTDFSGGGVKKNTQPSAIIAALRSLVLIQKELFLQMQSFSFARALCNFTLNDTDLAKRRKYRRLNVSIMIEINKKKKVARQPQKIQGHDGIYQGSQRCHNPIDGATSGVVSQPPTCSRHPPRVSLQRPAAVRDSWTHVVIFSPRERSGKAFCILELLFDSLPDHSNKMDKKN